MATARSAGFNKEKLIFLLTGLALGASVWYFLASQPDTLGVQRPLTGVPKPPGKQKAGRPLADMDSYLHGPRKSPFTPNQYEKAITDDGRKGGAQKPGGLLNPPPGNEGATEQVFRPVPDKTQEPQKFEPRLKELEVDLVGMVGLGDQTRAFLKRKSDATTITVREGQVLEDLKYKIVRIAPEDVRIQDEEQQLHILKRPIVGDVADAGKPAGGQGPAAVPAAQRPPKQDTYLPPPARKGGTTRPKAGPKLHPPPATPRAPEGG